MPDNDAKREPPSLPRSLFRSFAARMNHRRPTKVISVASVQPGHPYFKNKFQLQVSLTGHSPKYFRDKYDFRLFCTDFASYCLKLGLTQDSLDDCYAKCIGKNANFDCIARYLCLTNPVERHVYWRSRANAGKVT